MISAQDKIMHVANKLGLTSLKDMQASTGAVYDVDVDFSGQIFSNASRHQNPGTTNVVENQFEVNEALLIESIGFYTKTTTGDNEATSFQRTYGSSAVLVFDLVIGNKRVMKDTPVFGSGSPSTFASSGVFSTTVGGAAATVLFPRHQIFMEGAGILIPPQVQWFIQYNIYDVVTGSVKPFVETNPVGCYLFGTKVLLNFNTSI